jgi:hypothetical protein
MAISENAPSTSKWFSTERKGNTATAHFHYTGMAASSFIPTKWNNYNIYCANYSVRGVALNSHDYWTEDNNFLSFAQLALLIYGGCKYSCW